MDLDMFPEFNGREHLFIAYWTEFGQFTLLLKNNAIGMQTAQAKTKKKKAFIFEPPLWVVVKSGSEIPLVLLS